MAGIRFSLAALLIGLLGPGAALAAEPDYAREARLADEIVDIIFDGGMARGRRA